MTNESLLATLKKTPVSSPEYNRIRTVLIESNKGLIGMVLGRRGIKNRTHREDCMAQGMVSLLKAIDAYNPKRGMFSTYATRAIQNDITKFQRNLTKEKTRTPFSFDPTREERANDTDALRTRESATELRRLFEENVGELTNVEREVISRRFGFSGDVETLEAIGCDLEVSKERVRQIEKNALSKLRETLATL